MIFVFQMEQLCESGGSAVRAVQGPRMCQQMVQTAIFFTLFELFKSKLKPSSMRKGAPCHSTALRPSKLLSSSRPLLFLV